MNSFSKINKQEIRNSYSKKTLINLYSNMLLIKELDNRATILQKTGLMHTYPPAHGHEAISVALSKTLKHEDVFTPYYRDHGTLLFRGAKPVDILNYWSGKLPMPKTGSNDLPMAIPIATQCSHAAGIAYAIKIQKLPHIVLCSLGDGATSKGDFYESLNFSNIHQLPIIFLISNNQWAISTPLEKQSATINLAQKGHAFNCESYQVDGTDIFELLSMLNETISICRSKQRPVLIEAITYRLGNHTTVDNALKYMPKEQLNEALKHSPVNKLKNFLLQQKILTDQTNVELMNKINNIIENAAIESINTQAKKYTTLFDNVYHKIPTCLNEQKQILATIYK